MAMATDKKTGPQKLLPAKFDLGFHMAAIEGTGTRQPTASYMVSHKCLPANLEKTSAGHKVVAVLRHQLGAVVEYQSLKGKLLHPEQQAMAVQAEEAPRRRDAWAALSQVRPTKRLAEINNSSAGLLTAAR